MKVSTIAIALLWYLSLDTDKERKVIVDDMIETYAKLGVPRNIALKQVYDLIHYKD